MAQNPMFVGTPLSFIATASTANTNRDGTGTIVDITTAAPSGGLRLDDMTITARSTTTAGTVHLFIHNGTGWSFWRDIAIPAITVSGTVPPFTQALTNLALVLQSGWKIGFAPNNAEAFNVIVTRAGSF